LQLQQGNLIKTRSHNKHHNHNESAVLADKNMTSSKQ